MDLEVRRFLTLFIQALLIKQETQVPHNLLLIADPDPERRRALMQSCQRQGGQVLEAPSLGEGRRLLNTQEISYILVAAALADLYEFSAFLQNCHGAEVVVYGAVRQQMSGARYVNALGNEELRNSLKKLKIHSANQASNVSCEQLAQKNHAPDHTVILLGASTGGVVALETILSEFHEDCPPTLIVQHIREGFAESMVRRFDQILRPQVVEAREGQTLTKGTIYIAVDNNRHLGLVKRGGTIQTHLVNEGPVAGHCPSVNVLFREAARLSQHSSFRAALLTGMGNDGASGMKDLQRAGAHTIAQDKESCVVWGMPRAAIEIGAANEVLPLSRIAKALLEPATSSSTKRSA